MSSGAETGLIFDVEAHTYRNNGVVVPGVTSILKSVGIIDDSWFTEDSAHRGSVVHRLLELSDSGQLAPDWRADYTPEQIERLEGYLSAWGKFRAETDFQTVATEQPRVAADGRFAGTPDRIGEIYDSVRVVADVKTGQPQAWTALQLAAYSELCGVYKRLAVAIRPDGTYSIKLYNVADRRRDLSVFLACLTLYEWKEKNR